MTTLATLRTRTRDTLADTSTTFTDAQIDEAARYALDAISTAAPFRRVQSLTFAAASREISTAALTQPATIYNVWFPYLATSTDDPPAPAFETLPGSLLRIIEGPAPNINDVARVFYTTPHTLNGLDAAGTTTLDADGMNALTLGTAGHVINARLRAISETVRADPGSTKTLATLRDSLIKDFNTALAAMRKKAASRACGYIHWP